MLCVLHAQLAQPITWGTCNRGASIEPARHRAAVRRVRLKLEAERARVSLKRPRFAPFRFVGKLRSGRRDLSSPLSPPSDSPGSQRFRFTSWWGRHTESRAASDLEGLEAGGGSGSTPLGSSTRRVSSGAGGACSERLRAGTQVATEAGQLRACFALALHGWSKPAQAGC